MKTLLLLLVLSVTWTVVGLFIWHGIDQVRIEELNQENEERQREHEKNLQRSEEDHKLRLLWMEAGRWDKIDKMDREAREEKRHREIMGALEGRNHAR